MYLIQKIEDLVRTSPDTRSLIGKLVLEERAGLSNWTITDVAEACHTSKTTVVRFAKALGYSGWREFVRDFLSEIHFEDEHPQEVDFDYPFAQESSPDQIAHALFETERSAVEETIRLLDNSALKLAKKRIIGAENVLLFGVSPNHLYAELFRRRLLSIGIRAQVVPANEMGLSAMSMTSRDCAILISYSGNNRHYEPMIYIDMLKRNDVAMIGITSAGENYMRKKIDCILTIASKEHLYDKISNFYSEESILFLFNLLFCLLFQQDFEGNRRARLERVRVLEQKRFKDFPELPGNPPSDPHPD